MAEAIWKFPLLIGGHNDYCADMPADAKALSVDFEPDVDGFVVWAIVTPGAKSPGTSWFHISGTGHPLPAAMRHGGRFLNRIDVRTPHGGLLRFHAFETGEWRAGREEETARG